MDGDISEKIRQGLKFYRLKQESVREELERKRLAVLEMEYRLEVLRKDLSKSGKVLDIMREHDR